MHVRNLPPFWSNAAHSDAARADLETLTKALEPFGAWDISSFAQFLKAVEPFGSATEDLLAKVKLGDDPLIAAAQDRAASSLAVLAPTVGLSATVKVDKKWIERQRNAERSLSLAKRLRALSEKVIAPESYGSPELQPEFEAFAALSAADWKLLESAMGHSFTGKGRGKIEAAVAKLSGQSPPKPVKVKATKSKPAGFTPEQFAIHVQRLKERIARSNDRERFPRREVDEEISELSRLDVNLIRAVLQESNFEVGKKDSKPKMLDKLRDFLDAGHRAFERIQA